MLRVRPIHYTARPEPWERLLNALGMVLSEDDGGRRVFDSGAGRLALQSVAEGAAENGSTELAVEVGDLVEFARRTNLAAQEDGNSDAGPGTAGTGPAEVIAAGPAEVVAAETFAAGEGAACRITSSDGFSFLADKAAHGAQCADADPALAVVGVWFTGDTAAAVRTLRQIGARPRPVPDNDETADFTAKNGGILLVRPASGTPRAGLGFEYQGTLDPLRERLTAAGFEVSLTEEAFGRTLHVAHPDADAAAASHVPATIWISERRPMG